jgi:hypothetical protein
MARRATMAGDSRLALRPHLFTKDLGQKRIKMRWELLPPAAVTTYEEIVHAVLTSPVLSI